MAAGLFLLDTHRCKIDWSVPLLITWVARRTLSKQNTHNPKLASTRRHMQGPVADHLGHRRVSIEASAGEHCSLDSLQVTSEASGEEGVVKLLLRLLA